MLKNYTAGQAKSSYLLYYLTGTLTATTTLSSSSSVTHLLSQTSCAQELCAFSTALKRPQLLTSCFLNRILTVQYYTRTEHGDPFIFLHGWVDESNRSLEAVFEELCNTCVPLLQPVQVNLPKSICSHKAC